MSLTDSDGMGLIAVGMPNIDISNWPYTMTDLEKVRHIHELPQRDMISVNIDHKQMDSGGNDSWSTRTHPEYTLPAKPYSYRFRLTPYTRILGDIRSLYIAACPK